MATGHVNLHKTEPELLAALAAAAAGFATLANHTEDAALNCFKAAQAAIAKACAR